LAQSSANLKLRAAVQNEMMTPTFKLKRPQLQKHYQAVIDSMYSQLNSKS
jgi:long-chain acyl-CoA synthetase